MRNDSFSRLLSNYLTQYLPGIRGLGTNTILSYRDMFKNLVIFYETVLEIKPDIFSIGLKLNGIILFPPEMYVWHLCTHLPDLSKDKARKTFKICRKFF